MAELEIAGTAALGGCVGDEKKSRRTFKKDGQRGRSERRVEAYFVWYVEGLSDTRTKLTAFFNVLLRGGLLTRRLRRVVPVVV